MTGLQTAFYIVGIVYMGISLILILGVVTAVFVIRAKIVSLENMVKEKLETITSFSSKAAEAINLAKKITKRKSS